MKGQATLDDLNWNGVLHRDASFANKRRYDRVLGVLVAWKRMHRQLGKHEVAFFLTIAAHLARAIHQAEAVDEVNRMLSGEGQEGAFIQGIQAASGVAIGTVAVLRPLSALESIPDRKAQDVVAEQTTFRTAVADVQRELTETVQRFPPGLSKDVGALFDVHIMLLGDDVLVTETVERIRAGNWALGVWAHAGSDRQTYSKAKNRTNRGARCGFTCPCGGSSRVLR